MGLNLFNAAAITHTFVVNNGNTAGSDLNVNSAIVDGSLNPSPLTKSGFGELEFSGSTANTYTGTTTVNEGTLLLNKGTGTGGVLALSGALTIGDANIQSGFAESDIVKLSQPNQLPDYNAIVTVNATGLFDLNGQNETIGFADGTTNLLATSALVVNLGTVRLNGATLGVNGDFVTTAVSTAIAGLVVTPSVFRPALIDGTTGGAGTLNLGNNFLRQFNIAAAAQIQIDAIISANISGAADIVRTTSAGDLLLSGNNSGLTGNVFLTVASNPTYLGSNNALGTGIIYPIGTALLFADGGARTLANNWVGAGFVLGGGNDLRLNGRFDLTSAATFTVSLPVELELAGGVGELASALTFAKSGFGFLDVSAPAYFSGAVTLNAGQLRLSGTGELPNIPGLTANLGATFTIDNIDNADSDRVRNSATVTLAGGAIELFGSPGSAINELLHTLTINNNFTSTVASHSQNQPTKLSFGSLARAAAPTNSFVIFNGASKTATDFLGTPNNQILFLNPPLNFLLNGIIPFAAVTKRGDIDFAGYSTLVGINPAAALNTLSGATAKDNVKLTGAGPFTVTPPPMSMPCFWRATALL